MILKVFLCLLLSILSLFLVSCDQAQTEAAHLAVKSLLKDPNSALFENERVSSDAVCGTYNAKNSYGGYGGRREYVYILATKRAHLMVDVHGIQSEAGFDEAKLTLNLLRSHCST